MQIKKSKTNSEYLKQLLQLFEPLNNASNYKIKKLLQKLDKNLIIKICEAVYNILHGTIPIKASDKKKLKRYRYHLHKLCKKNHSVRTRTKILQHGSGAFLSALVPAVITGISNLLGALN